MVVGAVAPEGRCHSEGVLEERVHHGVHLAHHVHVGAMGAQYVGQI